MKLWLIDVSLIAGNFGSTIGFVKVSLNSY
jgi:hypothetical protein